MNGSVKNVLLCASILSGIPAIEATIDPALALTITAASEVTVVPNSNAYSSGNCIGGVLAFPNLLRAGGPGSGVLTGASIAGTTSAVPTIDLFVFNQLPVGTYTDNTACSVSASDLPFLVGFIPGTSFSSAVDGSGTKSIESINVSFPYSVQTPVFSGGYTVYVVPIIRTATTYGATQSLYFWLKASPDSGS